MGLDVVVVNIEYLERPAQPIYGFLQALIADPNVGISVGDDMEDSYWGDGWGANAFYEFYRDCLTPNPPKGCSRAGQGRDERLGKELQSLDA